VSGVLCYHDLSERWQLGITSIPVERFALQLQYLRHRGFTFGAVDDMPAHPVPLRLAVSLDDAFESQLVAALPVLSAMNITATAFVLADYVGRPARWDYHGHDRRHAGWSQLREWLSAGMRIGSHGASHRDLRGMVPDQLRRELTGSRARIEDRLGVSVTCIAYPFGRHDHAVLKQARETGYRTGLTTRPPADDDSALVRGRVVVSRLDTVHSLTHRLDRSWWGQVERGKQNLVRFWAGGTSIVQQCVGAET